MLKSCSLYGPNLLKYWYINQTVTLNVLRKDDDWYIHVCGKLISLSVWLVEFLIKLQAK